MKNWIKKIGQNKFQFFFFVGVVCLMFAAIIIGSLNNNKQIEQPNDDTTVTPNPTPDDEGVGNISDEFVQTTSRLNMMNDGLRTTDELVQMVYLSAQNARGSFGGMISEDLDDAAVLLRGLQR